MMIRKDGEKYKYILVSQLNLRNVAVFPADYKSTGREYCIGLEESTTAPYGY